MTQTQRFHFFLEKKFSQDFYKSDPTEKMETSEVWGKEPLVSKIISRIAECFNSFFFSFSFTSG